MTTISSTPQKVRFHGQPLVNIHDGRAITTSNAVAEYFGKQHDNVLRDIRKIVAEAPDRFAGLNFEASKYIDATGRKLPAYRLTRDGFTLVAMGFTGKRALQFKLAYIDAFNRMEAELHRPAQDRLLAEPNYRAEARRFALDYFERCRALLPKGTKPPAWDYEIQQRIADAVAAAVLASNRWLLSFDQEQRMRLSAIPPTAVIIDPKDPAAIEALLREQLPAELLPMVMQIGLERLSRMAMRASA